MDQFSAVPVAAGKDELPRQRGSSLERVERSDQPHMVFCRVLKTRDINEVGPIQSVAVGDQTFGIGDVTGTEAAMIDSVVDDVYGAKGQSKKAVDIPGGG